MGLHGFELVNRAFEEFVGTHEPDVQRFDWTGYLHPDDREAYLAAYVDAFSRRTAFEASARLRRADGAYRWMRSVGQPRFLEHGQFVGHVGSTFDITDLKQAQESLRQLNRSKDVFLAMLSHELRNPLASIRNASHLLSTGALGHEAAAQAQDVIERQTRNMVRLVDDLLDVSRITAGKISLRKETVSLPDAIRHAISATEHHRLRRGQELSVALPQTPLRMRADAARIDQILGNLLINASKFTPTGGHVWVSVETAGDPIDTAVIVVRDNGEGISAEMLPRIFDLFAQGAPSTDNHVTGVGIGLALTKLLVELHAGTIEARSGGAGLGSEFVVRLPLGDAETAKQPASSDPESAFDRSPKRILVVDDNHDAAESQAALLQLAGHAVRTAFDGHAALAAAREFHPEVILLDIGLPGEDGYRIARRLRSDPSSTDAWIVALTGFGSDEDVERSRAAGFDEHLTKPVEPQRLLRIIARRQRSG
jgi:PAS domain S-box-containing protein